MRISLVLALTLAACGGRDDALSPADAARLLEDRNWLDVMPRNEHERLHVFRFTPRMGGGVYQDRTLFKGSFELFQYEVGDGKLQFKLPHTREVVRTSYRIRRTKEHKPFDLELTLDHSPRGPSRYFGFSDEKATEASTRSSQTAPLVVPPMVSSERQSSAKAGADGPR
jgi:hypothetical protein